MTVPTLALLLAAALFSVGLVGVMVRRNLVIQLICAELMLNAAGLALISGGSAQGSAAATVPYLAMLTMAAAELAVGLVIVRRVLEHFGTLDTAVIVDGADGGAP
jgi:NADH-quinone oxidoreductase subunit K